MLTSVLPKSPSPAQLGFSPRQTQSLPTSLRGARWDLRSFTDADWRSIWEFRKLKQFIEHKPEKHGVFVDTVNPKNMSKRCTECGCVHEDNRHRDEFECQRCGKQNYADYSVVSGLRPAWLCDGEEHSRVVSPAGPSVVSEEEYQSICAELRIKDTDLGHTALTHHTVVA